MYERLLVPLDGSELAECVFPHLEAFIQKFSLKRVFLVRVVRPLSISSGLQSSEMEIIRKNEVERKVQAEAYLEGLKQVIPHPGVEFETEVVVGDVAESLMEYSHQKAVDLILMATHGRSGISRWVMGSVADKILRSAATPILMIRTHPQA